MTTLIIRDLTGSTIIGVSLSADAVPAFSVNAIGPNYEIGFAFSETQFAASDAMQIVTMFAEQLETPLLYLV
jgi:hypothetical protein